MRCWPDASGQIQGFLDFARQRCVLPFCVVTTLFPNPRFLGTSKKNSKMVMTVKISKIQIWILRITQKCLFEMTPVQKPRFWGDTGRMTSSLKLQFWFSLQYFGLVVPYKSTSGKKKYQESGHAVSFFRILNSCRHALVQNTDPTG